MKNKTGAIGKDTSPVNISDQTLCLLEFVNFGKKPGELSPPTLDLSEKRLKKDRRPMDIEKPDFSGLRFWPLPDGSGTYVIEKGYIWKRSNEDKEPVPIGKADVFPKIKLPLKEGFMISEEELEGFDRDGRISGLWYELRSCFFYIAQDKGNNYFCDEFLTDYLGEESRPEITVEDGELKFISDPLNRYKSMLGYFGNFYLSEKNVHPLLMQCPCCGRFWFRESKPGKGRQRKFCTPKCEDVYNMQSKEWKSKIKRDNQRFQRKKDEVKNLSAIIEKAKTAEMRKEHVPEEKARILAKKQAYEESHSWVFQQNKRMKDHPSFLSYHGK